MMTQDEIMYDHYHVIIKNADGEVEHIESGLSPRVSQTQFNEMLGWSPSDREAWMRRVSGIPDDSVIINFKLGG